MNFTGLGLGLYLRAVEEVLRRVIKPETDLEAFLLRQPEIKQGMAWGVPRFGHPEGAVYRHVGEVLANVDRLPGLTAIDRLDLRLVTIVHDTFKYAEDKSEPRDWSRHHGILAREYLSRFTRKRRVLDLTEWHDEAYYCWRLAVKQQRLSRARQRMDVLTSVFDGELDFYYRFFLCDTRTGDKNQAPVRWFERECGLDPVAWTHVRQVAQGS